MEKKNSFPVNPKYCSLFCHEKILSRSIFPIQNIRNTGLDYLRDSAKGIRNCVYVVEAVPTKMAVNSM